MHSQGECYVKMKAEIGDASISQVMPKISNK